MSGVDYYALLGVEPDASTAQIKSAYRSLAKLMHPDAGGNSGTFRALQEAYETLSDPVLRAEYDRPAAPSPTGAGARPNREHRRRPRAADRSDRTRRFGGDPSFVPAAPRPDPADIPWWDTVNPEARVRYLPPSRYPRLPLIAATGAWILLLPAALATSVWPLLLVLWLLPAGAGLGLACYAPHYLPPTPAERHFVSEHGDRRVFGLPGAARGEQSEQLTAGLLEQYLTRLPGVRIFHGLSWPDSVFADVDHAVLCARRLVLIESKMWLPGHYTADEAGTLHRNGRPFRGGGTRLAETVSAFRELLPGVDVVGALVLYPSREGVITADEHSDAQAPPMTPEQFVRGIGGYLAQQPTVLDRDAFHEMLARVVS